MFLNRAVTDEGVFINRHGKGTFRVFSFGAAALGRMVQLEEDALRAKGFDPVRSRVVRVDFGIVRTGKGYDLGVKKIEAEPVRLPAVDSGKTAQPTDGGAASASF